MLLKFQSWRALAGEPWATVSPPPRLPLRTASTRSPSRKKSRKYRISRSNSNHSNISSSSNVQRERLRCRNSTYSASLWPPPLPRPWMTFSAARLSRVIKEVRARAMAILVTCLVLDLHPLLPLSLSPRRRLRMTFLACSVAPRLSLPLKYRPAAKVSTRSLKAMVYHQMMTL